jgi:hypothetical protein
MRWKDLILFVSLGVILFVNFIVSCFTMDFSRLREFLILRYFPNPMDLQLLNGKYMQ